MLKELIENESATKNCGDYWMKRLCENDALYSTFNELNEGGYIRAAWGDNVPYVIFIQQSGFSYIDNKRRKKYSRWTKIAISFVLAIILAIISAMIAK